MLIAFAVVVSFCITPVAYGMSTPVTEEMSPDMTLGDYAISSSKAEEISEKVVELNSMESFKSIEKDSILEIGNNSSSLIGSAEYYKSLTKCISDSIPVVSLDGVSVFTDSNLDMPTAFVENATASGVYYDKSTGAMCCYSVKCDDLNEARNRVYGWADDKLAQSLEIKENVSLASSAETPVWGGEIQSYGDISCGDYGWFYIRTNYYEQMTNSNTYRYYQADYKLQAVPNTNANTRIADMNVQCDVDKLRSTQKLLDYGPTTTSGSSTASVNLNWSISLTGGFQVGMGIERSYSIPDIMVHDYSSFGDNLFTCSHDIQESGNVGSSTILVKPGLIASSARSTDNGSYTIEDNYSVNYCKYQKVGSSWSCQNYHLFYTTLNVNIP